MAVCPSAVAPDIQRIAEAVSEQVERESGENKKETREDNKPPGRVVIGLGFVQERPPRGRRVGDAEAEVREGRLEQDALGDQQGRVHDEGAGEVRQDLTED